jgi:CYTH domain-containing protein
VPRPGLRALRRIYPPASSHLQLFDNYIENTRIRLRQIRDPYSNSWTRTLQQRFPWAEGEYAVTKLAEIHLNDDEYAVFSQFEGREIRKNRYFHEFDLASFTFDIYLGALWGLNTARVDFETRDRLESFIPPPFAVFEVTNDPFFTGEKLVEKKFTDVQAEVARIGLAAPPETVLPDE